MAIYRFLLPREDYLRHSVANGLVMWYNNVLKTQSGEKNVFYCFYHRRLIGRRISAF